MAITNHALLPKARKTYQVVPGPKMGLVTPEILENIARVAREFNIPLLKITAAQRLAFVGLDPADVDQVWQALGHSEVAQKAPGIHYVQACPGVTYCRYGCQNSLALGEQLQEELLTMPLPAKTKIGVSGCSMNCCEGFVRDVGIFARKKGWAVVFGGNSGGRPRIGDIISEGLEAAEVVVLVKRCLDYYGRHGRKRERTARFMERIGLETLKEAVLR